MQEEVSNKTVTLVIRATKLTSGVLLSAINPYFNTFKCICNNSYFQEII